ncbi:MAG: methylated-DNA--[protein]-cysteine S-methyltransferase [Actinomycetota bacterium]
MTPSTEWLDSLASAAVAEGLTDVTYEFVATPIGRLLVATTNQGVCRVAFQQEDAAPVLEELAWKIGSRVVRSRTETESVRRALAAYLEGDPVELAFPVDLSLTHSSFRRTVLEHLKRVGRGHVVTYGELARRAGAPRAARAVGTACATNPVPIIVPCHRVLPSSGGVGNYGGGPERKVFLLELEGALDA